MLKNFTTVTVSLLGAVATSAATLPSPSYAFNTLQEHYNFIERTEKESINQETATKEVAPEKPKEMRFICKGCNVNESRALDILQDRGITDKNALATILGNIRQESGFVPNICEGGSRTSYRGCGRGYGLIQWTSSDRYYGLGKHAIAIKGNPSTLETQMDYLFTETQWKRIETRMKDPGKSINDYMRLAYSWIGWGIHGARSHFARSYANRLVLSEVENS